MKSDEPDWGEVFSELRSEEPLIDPFEGPDDDDDNDEPTVAVPLIDFEAAEIRRGLRLLKKKLGSHRGPGGDPSPAEIKAMAAAIRSTWRGADLRRSRCGQSDSVELKTVSMGE